MIAAVCGGVRVVSVYAPNGRVVGSTFYAAKLAWFDRLSAWLEKAAKPGDPLVLGGDLNVAPEDIDVWDPRACHGGTHVSPPEREAFARLGRWGLVDAYRARHPEPGRYTWWDYRAGMFHKNFGMRIDHLLVSAPLAERTVAAEIDREARKGKPIPSDHAPLVIDLDAPGCRVRRRLVLRGRAHRRPARADAEAAHRAHAREAGRPSCREGEGWLFEPKWDGFRAIVFKDGDDVYLQSRDLKPLDRYFPELSAVLRESLPARCVVDGEIVIASDRGLDFDALQLRLHPAASRVAKLAAETPSSFVAFDLLALGDEDLRGRPQAERRGALEKALAGATGRVHLTPCTRDRGIAQDWFHRFEGAGFDGVIAKHEKTPYEPGKRSMIKVKHVRTADCVVAGFRWHKDGRDARVGSLLLGLYDSRGTLHHVGVTSSFTMAVRGQLAKELEPLRKNALEGHPWREWAGAMESATRMPGDAEPLERGQGPVLGAAAHRARLRGEVRPPAGRPLPPRGHLHALAARQAARGVPLRPAGGHASGGAGGDLSLTEAVMILVTGASGTVGSEVVKALGGSGREGSGRVTGRVPRTFPRAWSRSPSTSTAGDHRRPRWRAWRRSSCSRTWSSRRRRWWTRRSGRACSGS